MSNCTVSWSDDYYVEFIGKTYVWQVSMRGHPSTVNVHVQWPKYSQICPDWDMQKLWSDSTYIQSDQSFCLSWKTKNRFPTANTDVGSLDHVQQNNDSPQPHDKDKIPSMNRWIW